MDVRMSMTSCLYEHHWMPSKRYLVSCLLENDVSALILKISSAVEMLGWGRSEDGIYELGPVVPRDFFASNSIVLAAW
jgi:hypothetical protein